MTTNPSVGFEYAIQNIEDSNYQVFYGGYYNFIHDKSNDNSDDNNNNSNYTTIYYDNDGDDIIDGGT